MVLASRTEPEFLSLRVLEPSIPSRKSGRRQLQLMPKAERGASGDSRSLTPSRLGMHCDDSYNLRFLIVTARTNPGAETIRRTRGTALTSTGGGTPGKRLPYRTYSTHGRRYKTRGRLCGATNHIMGIEAGGRMGRDFSLGRGRDPKQRTIWRGDLRRRACPVIMT
jgi:hypothetical protein